MRAFWGTIFLPLVWMALTGDFSAGNFLIGILISSLVLWVLHPAGPGSPLAHYLTRGWRWFTFLLFFVWELVLASMRITWDILTPQPRMRPAILAIPLDVESEAEITTLANLITLTPGTLSLDVSGDRRLLFVHAMYVADPEEFKNDIKCRLERRVKELFQ